MKILWIPMSFISNDYLPSEIWFNCVHLKILGDFLGKLYPPSHLNYLNNDLICNFYSICFEPQVSKYESWIKANLSRLETWDSFEKFSFKLFGSSHRNFKMTPFHWLNSSAQYGQKIFEVVADIILINKFLC